MDPRAWLSISTTYSLSISRTAVSGAFAEINEYRQDGGHVHASWIASAKSCSSGPIGLHRSQTRGVAWTRMHLLAVRCIPEPRVLHAIPSVASPLDISDKSRTPDEHTHGSGM